MQAGSTVVAQLTGPRGTDLATVQLSNGAAVIGASTSVSGLVTIAGSPAGEIAVLQSAGNGSLSIYSAASLSLVRTVGLPAPARDVALDAAGKRVLVAAASGGVNVYNNGAAGLSLAAKLAEATSPLLTQSKDGRFVTGSRSSASEFIVWDSQSWQPVGRSRLVSSAGGLVQDGTIVDARVAASGDRLVATSDRGTFVSELADATITRVSLAGDEVASVQLGVRVDQLNRQPNTAPVKADLLEDRNTRGQLRTTVKDEDGDTLWFRLLTNPANGKLDLEPTGDWTYQPSANFNGSDRAVVRVFDGQAYSDLALVFDVAAINVRQRSSRRNCMRYRKQVLLKRQSRFCDGL